jgi:hypothetical protein
MLDRLHGAGYRCRGLEKRHSRFRFNRHVKCALRPNGFLSHALVELDLQSLDVSVDLSLLSAQLSNIAEGKIAVAVRVLWGRDGVLGTGTGNLWNAQF